MFCYQCQEASKNTGCSIVGVCGKTAQLASIQDVYKESLKSLATEMVKNNSFEEENCLVIVNGLFKLITNANFNQNVFIDEINNAIKQREILKGDTASNVKSEMETIIAKSSNCGILNEENEDIRSVRELVITGLMGMSAYYSHAVNLGHFDKTIEEFIVKSLAQTAVEQDINNYLTLINQVGEYSVNVMALLDTANNTTFGNSEISEVDLSVGTNPGILISGHDLHDIEQLLIQTEGTGVDVYTHSEMLPAHFYPRLKKYTHLVGNYGGAWHTQRKDFATFNGPILFTTNCIVPPLKDAVYADRVFTTNNTGFEGWTYIEDGDYSQIIKLAKTCEAPVEIDKKKIVGGFNHKTVLSLADKIISEITEGNIKRFVVMAGCDGRQVNRSYYEEFATKLPQDAVILTAGCAKYRYNKLDLGDINGIPRVLDAGQCNDSYSLAVVALTLKKVLGLDDINDLPIVYNIAWYEQKAVTVLLALLYLGVKNIKLGPTLPAFISPNVAKVLVDNYQISTIGTVGEDLKFFNLDY